MSKHNYEQGGRVKISGKWYEVVGILPSSYRGILLPIVGAERFVVPEFFIEAYEPPKPKSFEWVPKHYDFRQARNGMTHHESVNAWLAEKYGDPTERVYNGEDASEFGLEPDSDVLEWRKIVGCWTCVSFYLLIKGNIWRKQPPLLTTKKGGEA
jgi:hypothetical protein